MNEVNVIQIGKEKVQLHLFAGDVNLNVGKTNNSTKNAIRGTK